MTKQKKGIINKESVGVSLIVVGLVALWLTMNHIETEEHIETYVSTAAVIIILIGLYLTSSLFVAAI